MSQNSVDYSQNPTGVELMDNFLAKSQENFLTTNSGLSRPEYAKEGTLWIDKSLTRPILKMYNGDKDVLLGEELSQTIDDSTTKYPSNKAVSDYVSSSSSSSSSSDYINEYGIVSMSYTSKLLESRDAPYPSEPGNGDIIFVIQNIGFSVRIPQKGILNFTKCTSKIFEGLQPPISGNYICFVDEGGHLDFADEVYYQQKEPDFKNDKTQIWWNPLFQTWKKRKNDVNWTECFITPVSDCQLTENNVVNEDYLKYFHGITVTSAKANTSLNNITDAANNKISDITSIAYNRMLSVSFPYIAPSNGILKIQHRDCVIMYKINGVVSNAFVHTSYDNNQLTGFNVILAKGDKLELDNRTPAHFVELAVFVPFKG